MLLHKTYNIDKVLVTIASIFIFFALSIIAVTPPVTGYDISMYDAYPGYFWFFLIVAIACSIIILVHRAFDGKESSWWIAGYLVVLFTNSVILLLPIFRGFASSRRYDTLNHIGMIKDILLTGHFLDNNLYPRNHIIAANASYFTGLEPELLVLLLPTVFFLFYIVSLHLFSRTFARSSSETLLITVFGSLLLFSDQNSMFFPTLQCFQMAPFILFLFYRANGNTSKSVRYSFLLLMTLFLVPFTHPGEGALFLLFIFSCFAHMPTILRRVGMSSGIVPSNPLGFRGVIVVLEFFIVVWFTWFSYFATFAKSVNMVFKWLVQHIGSSTFAIYEDTYSEAMAKSGFTVLQLIDIFIKIYGQLALYLLAASAISIFYWWKFVFSPKQVSQTGVTFTFLFTAVGAATFAFILAFPHTSFTRNINYILLIATILNGLGFYELINRQNKKTVGAFLICLFLIASATIGLFNTFPSPIMRDCYFAATHMEFEGTHWFLEHQNGEYRCLQINFALMRFAVASVGSAIPANVEREGKEFLPPDHFGYKENRILGMAFAKDTYFVDSKISRIGPLVFPEYVHLLKFKPEDFHYLDNYDPSTYIIYNNGEFWVYYVKETS